MIYPWSGLVYVLLCKVKFRELKRISWCLWCFLFIHFFLACTDYGSNNVVLFVRWCWFLYCKLDICDKFYVHYELLEERKYSLFRILFLNSNVLEFGFKLYVVGSLMNFSILSLILSFSGWLSSSNNYCFGCSVVNPFLFVWIKWVLHNASYMVPRDSGMYVSSLVWMVVFC